MATERATLKWGGDFHFFFFFLRIGDDLRISFCLVYEAKNTELKVLIRVLELRDGKVFVCMKTPNQSDSSPQDKYGEFLSAQGHPLYPTPLFGACSQHTHLPWWPLEWTLHLCQSEVLTPSPQRSSCLKAL